MQNLRDKLLKAGVIDAKQKRKSEHEQRQDRHNQKGHDLAQQAEQQRRALYEAQLAEQRARDQVLVEQQRAEYERKERDLRARYLADHYQAHGRPGRFRWYFVTREGQILFVMPDPRASAALELGQYAIVERPRAVDEPSHVMVPRAAAEMMWALDDAYVRFYNRDFAQRPMRAWETE